MFLDKADLSLYFDEVQENAEKIGCNEFSSHLRDYFNWALVSTRFIV